MLAAREPRHAIITVCAVIGYGARIATLLGRGESGRKDLARPILASLGPGISQHPTRFDKPYH